MHFLKASAWTPIGLLSVLTNSTRHDWIFKFAYADILWLLLICFISSSPLASETSLEDTQASYIERLRQKSRSIPMNGNVHSHEMFTHLRRAVSKDTLNDSHRRSNTHLHTTDFPATSEKTLRPKSAGHQLDSPAIQGNVPEPTGEHLVNDFRSKRDFFENRTYAERAISKSPSVSPPTSSATVKPKVYTLYPMNSPTMNNKNSNHGLLQATTVNHNNHHQPHYVTR